MGCLRTRNNPLNRRIKPCPPDQLDHQQTQEFTGYSNRSTLQSISASKKSQSQSKKSSQKLDFLIWINGYEKYHIYAVLTNFLDQTNE
jgi:hypothetical protein